MGERTRTEVANSCPTEDALPIQNMHNLHVSMSDEWPDVPLTEAIVRNHVGRDNQIPASEIHASGAFPVVDQGQAFIAGYCNEERRVIRDELPLVIFGDHTRCFKYVDFPFILGADGTKVLKPDTGQFDPRFFYYALLNLDMPSRGYNRHFKQLKEKFIPKPPKAEQQNIAAVLGAVQRAMEQQERLIEKTAELKKTLLHQLFSRGLRGEPQKETDIGPIPQSWTIRACEELCDTITVGVVVQPARHYVQKGIPAFRSMNVREDRLETEGLVYFSEVENETVLAKSKLRTGDVLIVRTGYPGTSCVVPPEFDGTNCIDLVFARPKQSRVMSGYLSRYFNSPGGKAQAVAAKHGLAQQHLNVGAVKRVNVPLPSLDEQAEIDDSLATVQTKLLQHRYKHATLTALFHALLQQLMTAQIRI